MVKTRSEAKRDRLVALQADVLASRVEKRGPQIMRRMTSRGKMNEAAYRSLMRISGVGRYVDDGAWDVRQTVNSRRFV